MYFESFIVNEYYRRLVEFGFFLLSLLFYMEKLFFLGFI